MNVWISAKGLQEDKFKFPYNAKTSDGIKEFKDMNDVDNELVRTTYESEKQGFNVGEAVWYEHFYFCKTSDLIDRESQSLIKAYQYCTESNTSPYESLDKTPANFIDNWMIVRDELTHIRNIDMKERQNAHK